MRDYSMSINSYERPRALRRLLISLKEGDWRFDRLVVVDDASSQGSLRKISRICRNFQCDLISKRKRQYLTNSWNLEFSSSLQLSLFDHCKFVYASKSNS